ncbi:MAG: VanZ family protein [Candidatus Enteromonas sp.]|nr:VanZ family protein [Candidatus Enteromonas sp.]
MKNSPTGKKVFSLISWILFGVGALLIILFAATPGGLSSKESGFFSGIVKSILNFFSPGFINESNEDLFHSVLRKLVGHFGLFGFTGVFGYFAFATTVIHPKHPFLFHVLETLGTGLFLAFGSEGIQRIPGLARSGEFKDVLIDLSGFVLGLLLAALIWYLVERHQKKKASMTE